MIEGTGMSSREGKTVIIINQQLKGWMLKLISSVSSSVSSFQFMTRVHQQSFFLLELPFTFLENTEKKFSSIPKPSFHF